MINYLQSNQNNIDRYVIKFFLIQFLKIITYYSKNKKSFDKINMYIYNICTNYNINRKDFLKKFCYYLLNKFSILNPEICIV